MAKYLKVLSNGSLLVTPLQQPAIGKTGRDQQVKISLKNPIYSIARQILLYALPMRF